jgi:hypothetical protein
MSIRKSMDLHKMGLGEMSPAVGKGVTGLFWRETLPWEKHFHGEMNMSIQLRFEVAI